MTDPRDNLLDSLLVGEGGSNVEPASDPTLYGHVTLDGQTEDIEARSYQTFRLTYTVGRYGLDDTGAIRIRFKNADRRDPREIPEPFLDFPLRRGHTPAFQLFRLVPPQ